MGYLEICKAVIKRNDELIGYINPRHYSNWKNVDPMVLLIEGIHQFCVKAVKKIMWQKANIQLVPVQLKNIQFGKITCNEMFKITGKLILIGDVLSLSFIASRRGMLAKGMVIVSDLKGINK